MGGKKIPLNRVIILGVNPGIAGKFNETQEEAIEIVVQANRNKLSTL